MEIVVWTPYTGHTTTTMTTWPPPPGVPVCLTNTVIPLFIKGLSVLPSQHKVSVGIGEPVLLS